MRKLSFLLVLALAAASLFGCTTGGETTGGEAEAYILDLSSANPQEVTLPIANPPEKLTMVTTISATSAGQKYSLGDIRAFRELESRTGVQVEYQTVTVENLNLIFASDSLPDMIFTNWETLGGTYKYAVADQLMALDEVISNNSPNFVNVMKGNESIHKSLADVDGRIYYYPFVRAEDSLRVFEGYQVRKDWLLKLGLEVPESIDEMYETLMAFKTRDPNGNGEADEIPFISDTSNSGIDRAMNWWGIDAFYQDGGTVKCGWLEPEYKAYLTTMSQWYSDGLIDPDYLTTDTTQFKSRAVSEVAGSWYGRAAGVLGNLETTMSAINPEFSIVGIPWLSEDGETGKSLVTKYIENVIGIGIAVTTSCEKPELAAKWCDYAYGREGHLLMNFGIEGDSYTMEDGIPTYTEKITNDPNGLSMGETLATYAIPGNYAFEQSIYYFDQFMTGSQKDAINIWKKCDTSRILPTLKYKEEEIDTAIKKMNEIKSYVSTMQSKYITGKESFDNYDSFVKQIEKMGIEEVLQTMQTSYDRSRSAQ